MRGETFDIFCRPLSESWKRLERYARASSFIENVMWAMWRKHDPILAGDLSAWLKVKDLTGKWPPLERWFLGETPDGETPSKLARRLAGGQVASYVYDAIAHSVAQRYPKFRWEILVGRRRVPVIQEPFIRFREKAIRILRHPDNQDWFRVELRFEIAKKAPPLILDIKTFDRSAACIEWLKALADSGDNATAGTVSIRKRRGKRYWQLFLSRADGATTDEDSTVPESEERPEPVAGRALVVYAPLDQEVFLRATMTPVIKRPRAETVEAMGLIACKQRYEYSRRSAGRNYRQSPHSAAHGHGRKRAIPLWRLSERWERRAKEWIENRTTWLANLAVEWRCDELQCEDLSARDSSRLLMGSFPYYKFMTRLAEKAKNRGLKFRKIPSFEMVELALTATGKQVSADVVRDTGN